MSSSARESFERASAPAVRAITALPRWVPVVAVFALVVGGALLPYGWLLLGVVLLFLIWTLALSWPRLTSPEKLMRIAVLVLIGGITLVQALPR
ncbi:DUF6703 family protein [Janibacter sp. G56]|uniref:DUF6703 family protein n=1 Tax=Janibacter sp. G56 TaxID=3418717 RepID=UPI003CFC1456